MASINDIVIKISFETITNLKTESFKSAKSH